ncbi:MAG: hypothetical protein JW384_02828 [Nitrosomonadaceae bacterium]|nr:hypothetical protein [Nitrosomonadaceae bacterium]
MMSQAINVQLETPPLRLQAIESPQQGDIEVEPSQQWPLLPDDIYLGQIAKKELTSMKMFKGALRYFITFEITGPAEHSGKHVYGAWPVAAQNTSGGKVRAIVKPKGDLYIMLCRVLGYRVRPDRISFSQLQGCTLRFRTRTVRKNSRQRDYPESLQYSVVDDILEIVG